MAVGLKVHTHVKLHSLVVQVLHPSSSAGHRDTLGRGGRGGGGGGGEGGNISFIAPSGGEL